MGKLQLSTLANDDTIAAIATPIGRGGIGIIRLSGKKAINIAEMVFSAKCGKKVSQLRSNRMYYGHLLEPNKKKIVDEALLVAMRAPHSYTRQDVVEIHLHSSPVALNEGLEIIIKQGARTAQPGEFTKRAFLNGRIDLTRAEAVIETINAKSRKELKILGKRLNGGLERKIEGLIAETESILVDLESEIEFFEETGALFKSRQVANRINLIVKRQIEPLVANYQNTKIYTEGVKIAIAGLPNAGKSTLFNRLVGKQRAIVTEFAGTTRDLIEEYVLLDQVPIYFIDTAGIQKANNAAEKIGVELALSAIKEAEIVIFVVDSANTKKESLARLMEKINKKRTLLVFNKIDLLKSRSIKNNLLAEFQLPTVQISAKYGTGMEELKNVLKKMAYQDLGDGNSEDVAPNVRQGEHLGRALRFLKQAEKIVKRDQDLELAVIELNDALAELEAIVGRNNESKVLDKIFSKFCIGK